MSPITAANSVIDFSFSWKIGDFPHVRLVLKCLLWLSEVCCCYYFYFRLLLFVLQMPVSWMFLLQTRFYNYGD